MFKYLFIFFFFGCILISVSYAENNPNLTVDSANKEIKTRKLTDEKPIESDAEINKQLKSYSSISHWILENEGNIDKVLEDTAKKTQTKWLVEEQKDKSLKNDNSLINQNNVNISPNKDIEVVKNSDNSTVNNDVYHIVKAKETLFTIAKDSNTSVEEIKKLNNLTNSNINIGQKLLIKSENNKNMLSPDFAYPQFKYYKILRGDTLSSIAKQVNMTNNDIMKLNNMQTSRVYPGMVLKVNSGYGSATNNKIQFDWPIVGRLLVGFGPQKSGIVNEGINIMSKVGNEVKAVSDGVVIYVGSGLKGFGNLILLQHPNKWISVYAHVDNIKVKKGDLVKQGEDLAEIAKPTKTLKIPQLHFELRQSITPKDPLDYLNSYT